MGDYHPQDFKSCAPTKLRHPGNYLLLLILFISTGGGLRTHTDFKSTGF